MVQRKAESDFNDLRTMREFPTTHPRIIGLTGGIGSGKSTVRRALAAFGIPGWSADEAGRAVYRNHTELRRWVAEQWGEDLLLRDEAGRDVDVNRSALGAIVFQDPSALAVLSERIHPLIADAFSAWRAVQSHRVTPPAWVVREAAILFESGIDRDCAITLNIEAPEAERIERVMRRDGASLEAVRDRMSRQWSDEQRRERAHWTLCNGKFDAVLPQIEAFLRGLPVDSL
jgi:dephospho-CoA kinase